MNVIAKISCYLELGVVTLKLRKEYLNTVTYNTSVLLRIKYWTVWCIERYSMSTYTGVTNCQKTVRFFGPPCITRWKACGQLHIRHNLRFFVISYGWDDTSGNLSKSACFEGGESLWAQISDGRGRRSPTTVGVRILQCGIKISAVHCLVLSQSTRVTDGRTELRQVIRNRASIAAGAVKMKCASCVSIKTL